MFLTNKCVFGEDLIMKFPNLCRFYRFFNIIIISYTSDIHVVETSQELREK